MSQLYLDAGNTKLKYWLMNNDELLAQDAIDYQDLSVLSNLPLDTVALSAVNKPNTLVDWLENLPSSVDLFEASTGKSYKQLMNSYDNPDHMGIDRWLAMVASWEEFTNQSILVVDCGTAATIDFIAATGQHNGGYILPGTKLAAEALFSRAKKVLPRGDENESSVEPGNNTLAAVVHGCRFQVLAAIQQSILDFAPEVTVVSGGDGRVMMTHLEKYTDKTQLIFDPNLVMTGLKLWQSWNR